MTIFDLSGNILNLFKTISIVTLSPGGFALLTAASFGSTAVLGGATAGGLGLAGIAPVLGGLGLVGVAGAAGMAVMSVTQCGGPFSCVSESGMCCRLLFTTRGPICPASC